MKTLAPLKPSKDNPSLEASEMNLPQEEVSMGHIPSSLLNESLATTLPSVGTALRASSAPLATEYRERPLGRTSSKNLSTNIFNSGSFFPSASGSFGRNQIRKPGKTPQNHGRDPDKMLFDVSSPTWVSNHQQPSQSRAEAVLLYQAYEMMLSNIRPDGKATKELARDAARSGQPEELMALLEPELYVVDTVLVELIKQLRVGCIERGDLLEEIRLQVLEFFSVTALGLTQLHDMHLKETKANGELNEHVSSLSAEHATAMQKMAAMSIEAMALETRIKHLSEELETLKRKSQVTTAGNGKTRTVREIELERQLQEARDAHDLQASQLTLLEEQQHRAERSSAALQAQILDLQERIRRDAEEIECLSEEKARFKLRTMWLHTLLLLRRAPRERRDASTQDGDGLERLGDGRVSPGTEATADDGHLDAIARQDLSRRALFGRDTVITFPVFWDGIVANASGIDLEIDAPHLLVGRRELLELISQVYTGKLLADEQDDRAHFPRDNLPEFLYEHYLEQYGDASRASEALVRLVANLLYCCSTSPRVRMFARFLNLLPDQPVFPEAINVFLLSLVKLQGGAVPLLPPLEGVHVASAKATQTAEYIFSQAPYVVRSKILLEVERKVQGKNADLDSLLTYIVEQYMDEAGKGEERLKAIFVAADTDNDGQLEYKEYIKMMNHLGMVQSYRKLVRMYTEMTLNRTVTSAVFVHVCRKWKALLFEPGPAVKRVEKNASEVFALMNQEWAKLESIVLELLVVLEGTPVGQRLEEHVKLLRFKLAQKLEVEQTWHCYRSIVAEFTAAVKNRTPGLLSGHADDQAELNAAKARAALLQKRRPTKTFVKPPGS